MLASIAWQRHALDARTKAAQIYKKTGNLGAVQLLLGQTELQSMVSYLGIEVDAALTILEQGELEPPAVLLYRGATDHFGVIGQPSISYEGQSAGCSSGGGRNVLFRRGGVASCVIHYT